MCKPQLRNTYIQIILKHYTNYTNEAGKMATLVFESGSKGAMTVRGTTGKELQDTMAILSPICVIRSHFPNNCSGSFSNTTTLRMLSVLIC